MQLDVWISRHSRRRRHRCVRCSIAQHICATMHKNANKNDDSNLVFFFFLFSFSHLIAFEFLLIFIIHTDIVMCFVVCFISYSLASFDIIQREMKWVNQLKNEYIIRFFHMKLI